MADNSPAPITPEVFFTEKVAPQFRRRIDEMQRQIMTLQQQVQERMRRKAPCAWSSKAMAAARGISM